MKAKFVYILTGLILLTLASCKKWLDVKPEDKFLEEQLYSSPQGFYDALNGLYISNGSSNMYGGRLSAITLDVLAQYYAVNSDNANYTMSNYNYSDDNSQKTIDGIWRNMYVNIVNVNKLLESLDQYGKVLDNKTLNQYKGESYGLRAFYYFDLMRMFTPAYTVDSLSKRLPYYDKPTYNISEFQPSNFIMAKVLEDLSKAEKLLSESDPAINQQQVSKPTFAGGRNSRNYQMNYYAVKALQAKVNLWKDDKQAALTAAKFLIDNQAKFPWIKLADLNSAVSNKTFATEMIYGVENPKMNDIYNSNFSAALFDNQILAPNSSGTFINNTVFEGNAADYRYQYVWGVNGKPFPTFFKYYDSGTATSSYSFYRTVPLIRMSEMYLIAAECETNLTTAAAYVNLVRTNRNCTTLSILTNVALNTAIMKEFRKEVVGEGQLFFYYKRTRASNIVAGGTNLNIPITAANYTFPIPLSETLTR